MGRKNIDLDPEEAYDRFPELAEDDIGPSDIEDSTHTFTIVSRELQPMIKGGEHATATAISYAKQRHDRPATKAEIIETARRRNIIGNGEDQYSKATIVKRIGTLYKKKLLDRVETDQPDAQYAYKLSAAGIQEVNDLGEYTVDSTELKRNQKHKLLQAIDEAGRASIPEMMDLADLDRSQVHQAISELKKAAAVKKTGSRYVLTNGNGRLLLDTWNERFDAGFETLPSGLWSSVINDEEAYKNERR